MVTRRTAQRRTLGVEWHITGGVWPGPPRRFWSSCRVWLLRTPISVQYFSGLTVWRKRIASCATKSAIFAPDSTECDSSQSVAPSIEERVEVAEQRIEEQQQTKVESSQRVPVEARGMLLFNAFSSGRNGIPSDYPTIAVGTPGPNTTRGTMRQTTIGLEVQSPFTVAGARARGEVVMDFYGLYDGYPSPRLRTGFLDLQWPSTALRVGVEKPIVSQRNPYFFAQVIYPEMWGSGNLWLWLPQARLEQKFRIAGTDVTWQGGLLQTDDQRTVPPNSTLTLQPRPAWETRVAFGRNCGEDRGWSLPPVSTTAVRW